MNSHFFQLFVRTVAGKTITIQAKPTDTIDKEGNWGEGRHRQRQGQGVDTSAQELAPEETWEMYRRWQVTGCAEDEAEHGSWQLRCNVNGITTE